MTGTLSNLPRWLLSVEMAVCLVPLKWLFLAVLAMTGRGVMPLEFGFLAGSAALWGPLGLVVAMRIIFLSGSSVGRATATSRALLAAWAVLAYSVQVVQRGAPSSEWWRNFAIDRPPANLGCGALAADQFGTTAAIA